MLRIFQIRDSFLASVDINVFVLQFVLCSWFLSSYELFFCVDTKCKHFENTLCPIYVPVDIDVLVFLLLPYFLVC